MSWRRGHAGFSFSSLKYGLPLAAALFAAAASAQAQTPEAFYANREISLYVGSTAGSGYDAYGRAVSMFMEKYLPKGAHIVLKFMPGAGGLVATNYIANAGPKDGSAFLITQREAPIDPLMAGSETKAQFDPLKLVWLGTPNQEIGMVYVSTRSGAKTIQDAMTKELLIAAAGSTSGPAVYGRILNMLIGTKFKIVLGYVGSGDAMIAIENGEADGRITSGWAGPERAKATQWVGAGTARLLMQVSAWKSPDYPDLPYLMEVARNDDDRQVIQFLLTGQLIGNPFLAASDIPADRAAYLKKVFMSAVKDPDFATEAKKQLLVVGPVDGDELVAIMKKAYATPPELRKRALDIYNSAQN